MRRRRLIALAALALALLAPAASRAATGGVLRPALCFNQNGSGGCGTLPDEIIGTNPEDFAIAPDGTEAYLAQGNGVLLLSRNPTTGGLTEVGLKPMPTPGQSPRGIAVSADSQHVYVTGQSELVSYLRASDGLDFTNCLSAANLTGCTQNTSIPATGGEPIAISAAQVFTYTSGDLVYFNLGSGGAASFEGCVNATGISGCSSSASLIGGGGVGLAIDVPDQELYVASEGGAGSGTTTAFHSSGNGPQWAEFSCVSPTGNLGCTAVPYATRPRAIEVSQSRVAVGSGADGKVYLLARSPTGALSGLTSAACVANVPSTACPGVVTNANFVYGVAIDPSGGQVYYTAQNDGYLGVLDAGDALAQKAAPLGCFSYGTSFPGCTGSQPALNGPSFVRESSGGGFVYVDANTGVTVFRRYGVPTCSPASQVATSGVPITFAVSCSGYPGDALSVHAATGPAHGTLAITPAGAVTYTPTPGFVGSDSFSYAATGTGESTDPATATVLVKPAPTTPPPPGSTSPKHVTSGVTLFFKYTRTYTEVTKFKVTSVPKGGKVEFLCSGKPKKAARKCPTKKRKFTGGSVDLRKKLKLTHAKLPGGVVFDVRITAPGEIGKRVVYTFRKGHSPKSSKGCLALTTGKPAKC